MLVHRMSECSEIILKENFVVTLHASRVTPADTRTDIGDRFDFGFDKKGNRVLRIQAAPAQTMGCFDKLCSVPVETVAKRDIKSSIECDYDINPTGLYQALERKEWKSAMDFMVEGTWRQGPFMILFPGKDTIPPEKQASMWVTRFEKDGSVRWSQIPLHAAITFGAPMALVQKLIHLYPLSVRCTDDQGMLPLHLAFKFSSDVCILRLLLEEFQEGLLAKDIKGRIPTQVRSDERSKIIEQVINFMSKRIENDMKTYKDKELEQVKKNWLIQKTINEKLQVESSIVAKELKESKLQIREYQRQIQSLKMRLEKKEKQIRTKPLQVRREETSPLAANPYTLGKTRENENPNEASTFGRQNTYYDYQRNTSRKGVSPFLAPTPSKAKLLFDHLGIHEDKLDEELEMEKLKTEENLRIVRKLLAEKVELQDELHSSRAIIKRFGQSAERPRQPTTMRPYSRINNDALSNTRGDSRIGIGAEDLQKLLQLRREDEMKKRNTEPGMRRDLLRSNIYRDDRNDRNIDSFVDEYHLLRRTEEHKREIDFLESPREDSISDVTDVESMRGELQRLMRKENQIKNRLRENNTCAVDLDWIK